MPRTRKSLPLRRRGRVSNYGRRNDHDQFLAVCRNLPASEQPPQDRHPPKYGDLTYLIGGLIIGHTANYQALAFADHDLRGLVTFEDRGIAQDLLRKVGRVVVEHHLHLDLRLAVAADKTRGDLEPHEGVLELHLGHTRRGRARERDLEAPLDAGGGILHGHRLRRSQRACLALNLERLNRQVHVEVVADEPKEQTTGWRGAREGRKKRSWEIYQVSDRLQCWRRNWRSPKIGV